MKRKRITAKLRLHPDPILTKVCEPVKDGEDVSGIIRDMMHILTNSKSGVGLAAPQAGHLKRIILIGQTVMINPEFAPNDDNGRGPKEVLEKERCLSYPGRVKKIWAFDSIDIAYTDEDGNGQCDTLNGYRARVGQHEYKHLMGICPLGKCKVGEQ
jgi:peptide deformylase